MEMTPLCSCKQLGDKRECTKILPTPQNKLKTLFHTNFLINHFKTNVTVGKKIPTAVTFENFFNPRSTLEGKIVFQWIRGGKGYLDLPSGLHQTSAPQPSVLLAQQSRPKPLDPELALLEQAHVCT